jgi:hypothetical protein
MADRPLSESEGGKAAAILSRLSAGESARTKEVSFASAKDRPPHDKVAVVSSRSNRSSKPATRAR